MSIPLHIALWRLLMKAGDLVLLRGGIWTSYDQEGEIGLLLETRMMEARGGFAAAEFSKVWWGKAGKIKMCKSNHLEVVNESR